MGKMTFVEFRDLLNKHIEEMFKNSEYLFTVDVDKDIMWETYLNAFPSGTNPIYRKRTIHDCSCCRHFIKAFGNVVAVKNGKVTSIWDFECNDDDNTYDLVRQAMSTLIHSKKIANVYISTEPRISTKVNYEQAENGNVIEYNHFYADVPRNFMAVNNLARNENLNNFRTGKEVLLRALNEISMDSVDTVLDLIDSNTLYKGPEYKKMVQEFKNLKAAFVTISSLMDQDIFAWEMSTKLGNVVSRIRNHAIGTLLVDISNGVDIEEAVKKYETITAPSNYKRSKPVFTKRMFEDARKTIEDLGYSESLKRRFAALQDITVKDILFVNRNDAKNMKDGDSIFDQLSKMASSPKETKPQKFDGVEEIGADTFISDILPTAEGVEVYLENKHDGNFVSLIAPKNEGSKSMFKWGNNFSWAYSGNVTDSMKQRVKEFGGRIDGDLRFSIQWNEDGHDNCDLDAHCLEPNWRYEAYNGAYEIYFGSARAPRFSPTKGQLDVDIIDPNGNVAVENITWANRKTMKPGVYKFFVHVYSGRASKGFRAEIEFDGNIYSFNCDRPISCGQKISVADVEYCQDGTFKIHPVLPFGSSSKDIWNLKTNEFVPVTTICYSPNHWSTAENQTGHKHLFFMLKNCKSDETPSGMFNEYLVDELYSHRRVMEALSNEMRVAPSDDQLSGLGFALDKRADIVVKVSGTETKVFRVKF